MGAQKRHKFLIEKAKLTYNTESRAPRINDNGCVVVKLNHPQRKFNEKNMDPQKGPENDLNLGYIPKVLTKKGRIEKRFRRWSNNPKTEINDDNKKQPKNEVINCCSQK
jgi:hypothetical protein